MSYVGSGFSDLVKTEPNGTNEPVSNLDDAIRQVKRYLVDTLGQPDVSGSIFDAIGVVKANTKVPIGAVLPYATSGVWTAPTGYLKCDGNTIGNVSSGAVGSGAFYESADYENLFNVLKEGYGNAGDEIFAAGDTVKLPLIPTYYLSRGEEVTADVTATTANGGALFLKTGYAPAADFPFSADLTFGPYSLSSLTISETLESINWFTFDFGMVEEGTFFTIIMMSYIDAVEVSFDGGVNYLRIAGPSMLALNRYDGSVFTGDAVDFTDAGAKYRKNCRFIIPVQFSEANEVYIKIKASAEYTALSSGADNVATYAKIQQVGGLAPSQKFNFIIKAN